jgi:hypothetical protein
LPGRRRLSSKHFSAKRSGSATHEVKTKSPTYHRKSLKLTMHLSTVHGSSYYSGSVNSVSNISYTPLSTLIRRGAEGSGGMSGTAWAFAGVGILVLLIAACIGHAYFRSAHHKWKKDRRQKKHAQWYGQQAV